MELSNASNAAIVDGKGLVTVLDDEPTEEAKNNGSAETDQKGLTQSAQRDPRALKCNRFAVRSGIEFNALET